MIRVHLRGWKRSAELYEGACAHEDYISGMYNIGRAQPIREHTRNR